MLEGLDRIEWSRLSHAYGPATDVPGLIRLLAEGAEEERDRAIYELFGNIVHQGTVYEATPFAVPFLIELLDEPVTPGKSPILHLLQSISTGWLDCLRYAAAQGKYVGPSIAERHAHERRHYQAAHAAVQQGFESFRRLLENDDCDVRAGAAFVLATLIDRRADAAAVLLEASDDESDDLSRAAFLLALLDLVEQSPDDSAAHVAVRRFESVLEEGSSSCAALGAGIALLRLKRHDAISHVVELARTRLAADREMFCALPWDHANELFSLMSASLSFAPRTRLEWIMEGFAHSDAEVRSQAMFCGADFCRDIRWGPAELAPHYAKLADSPVADVRKMAIRYLGELGAVGEDRLQSLKKHALPDVRDEVGQALKRIASSRKERESWLAVKRPFLLPPVFVLMRLIQLHGNSQKWDDVQATRNAVINIGFHGRRAIDTAERIRSLADHENPWVRVHAIRTLWQISGDAALVVPLLLASLKPEPVGFLVLDCLQQIGNAARPVLPELHRIVDSEARYFMSGTTSDICALDETFRDMCLDVIRAIESMA